MRDGSSIKVPLRSRDGRWFEVPLRNIHRDDTTLLMTRRPQQGAEQNYFGFEHDIWCEDILNGGGDVEMQRWGIKQAGMHLVEWDSLPSSQRNIALNETEDVWRNSIVVDGVVRRRCLGAALAAIRRRDLPTVFLSTELLVPEGLQGGAMAASSMVLSAGDMASTRALISEFVSRAQMTEDEYETHSLLDGDPLAVIGAEMVLWRFLARHSRADVRETNAQVVEGILLARNVMEKRWPEIYFDWAAIRSQGMAQDMVHGLHLRNERDPAGLLSCLSSLKTILSDDVEHLLPLIRIAEVRLAEELQRRAFPALEDLNGLERIAGL